MYIDSNKLVRKGIYNLTFDMKSLIAYNFSKHDEESVIIKSIDTVEEQTIYEISTINHENNSIKMKLFINRKRNGRIGNLMRMDDEHYYIVNPGYDFTNEIIIFDNELNPLHSYNFPKSIAFYTKNVFYFNSNFYLWDKKIFKRDSDKTTDYPNTYFLHQKSIAKDSKLKLYNSSYGIYDSLKWEFSNGLVTRDEHPEIAFSDTGFIDIKLTLFRDGYYFEKETKKAFYVYNDVTPNFTIESISDKYPYSLTINNTSSGSISKYEWYLNDSLISKDKNPSIVIHNVGEFILKLKISNNYTSKEIEKGIFIYNKELSKNIILNSQINHSYLYGQQSGLKYNLTYSEDFKKYYINKVYCGPDNFSYNIPFKENKYYSYYYENNILKSNMYEFDNDLISGLQPQKEPHLVNSSSYLGALSSTIPLNKDLINYYMLGYILIDQNSMSYASSHFYTFLNIIGNNNNIIKERISLSDYGNSPHIKYIYFDDYLIIYRNKVLFINKNNYDLKLSKFYFDKIQQKQVAVYNDTFQLLSLDTGYINVEYYNIQTESYFSKKILYNQNVEFLFSYPKNKQILYIVTKEEKRYKLIEFDNWKSEVVNTIDLEIDNPKTMSYHKDNLIIYGSHKGSLAYQEIIDNKGNLKIYQNILGVFSEAESNQENQFLAEVQLDGITNKSFLLLMDYQEINDVKKEDIEQLVVVSNLIQLPNSHCDIEIYDLIGKKVKSEYNFVGENYNLSNLPPKYLFV